MSTTNISTESGVALLILHTPESEEVAAKIKAAHSKANSSFRASVEHALECGRLLREAKDRVKHGDWEKWLRMHARNISPRTASTYMKMDSNRKRVADLPGALRDVVRLLAEPKPTAPPPIRPRPPVTLDAEIVAPTAQDEPDAVVVDGTKDEETQGSFPKRQRILNYVPCDGADIWAVAKTHLDRILHNDTKRVEALTECLEYCQERISPKSVAKWVQIDMTQGEGGFPAVIAVMLPHLSKDQLCALKRAIALQWHNLTGGIEQ